MLIAHQLQKHWKLSMSSLQRDPNEPKTAQWVILYMIHPLQLGFNEIRFCNKRAVTQEKLTHVPWRKTSVCENGSSISQEECYTLLCTIASLTDPSLDRL